MTPGRRHWGATTVSTLIALAVLTVGLLSLTSAGQLPGSVADASPSPDSPARPRAPVTPVGGNPIQLRIDSMSPRVVTSTGPGELTVTGMLTNAGDQPVGDVEVRAQRSDRLRTDGDIRTALSGDAADDAVTPSFTRLADELAPGQQVPIELTVPLRGTETSSLALARTGIYDLLININGVPSGGDQARLAGVHALLPVLGLPAVGGRPAETTPAEPPAAVQPVSVLYPIADQPRRLPTGPAEPVLLGDDQLAADLAKGGRLSGLLDALEAGAPAGSPMYQATCLAIDPDLLRTVSDMVRGYRVRGPNGAETDGRGAQAAGGWLDRLSKDAAGRCVMALPYADADIVALSRAGLGDLTAYATRGGARIVADILRTQVRTDATWPADGLLDERSLTDFARAGGRTVVLSADAVSAGKAAKGATGGTVRLSAPGSTTIGLLTDPLVSLAASGPPSSEDRGLTSRLTSVTGSDPVNPTGSGGTLSDQNTIGAVAYRALGTGTASTPLLVAPPHQWHTTGADAKELLSSIATLVTSGRLAAAPLGGAPTEGPEQAATGTAASLVYPLRAGAREVPTSVTTRLRDDRNATEQLRAAAIALPGVGSTPDQVFNPVTEGILRAGSAVWRGRGELSGAATKVITDRVRLLRSLVRVLEPPSPYALGDKEAPLPITLSNGLPVGMQVRVQLSDTPGLRITSMTPDPLPPIPPMGRMQVKANAQLNKSGTFSVEARLTTQNGVSLGTPSRLQLRSTVYGTVTLWLTGIAFVLLVVLAMRRIIRRIRGGNSEDDRRARTAPSEPTPAPPAQAQAAPTQAAGAAGAARSMSGPATISTPISAVAEPGTQSGPPRGARIRGPVGPARSITPVARNNLLGYPNQPQRGSNQQGPVRGLPGGPAQNVPPPGGRPPRTQNPPPRNPAQGPPPVRNRAIPPNPPQPNGPTHPMRGAPAPNGQPNPTRQPNQNGRPPAGDNRAPERPDATGAAQAPDQPDTDQQAQQGGEPRARRNPEKTMPVHRTRQ